MSVHVASYIENLTPYVAGKPIQETQREYGVKKVTKLASNENALGPSPKAVQAIRLALKDLALYPDASGYDLRHALAKRDGVRFEEIVLGNGSNEVIEFLLKTLCVPGDLMVAGTGVFAAFPISARIHGVETLFAPSTHDHRFDLKAMLELIRSNPKVKLVALPNPNNPTGTYVTDSELIPFLQKVEKIRDGSVHVMLDYAYWEYVTATDLPEPISLYRKFSNVSILKTFSKIFGLGGLRVGYGVIRPELTRYVQKVRMPFNVSALALVGAKASLRDRAFVQKTLKMNRDGLKQMKKGFDLLDIPFLPSQGNFYLIHVKKAFGLTGGEAFEACLRQGMIFRPVTNYGMPDHLRVSIGTKVQNQLALKVLGNLRNPKFLEHRFK